MMPQPRYVLKACVATLLAGVLGAVALEVAARTAYRWGHYTPKIVTEPYLQPNPYLFQILKPGSHTRVRNARIDVNSLGFRGPEFSPRKPEGTYRVFVLGGSTTFGYPEGIPRTEDTYPFKLEQALRKKLGTNRVEVINAGVIGYTLRTSLVNYVTRLTWYEPDMIIVYHKVNDLIITRSEQDLYESVLRAEAGPTITEQVRDSSFLFLELNFRLFKLFNRPGPSQGVQERSDEPSRAALESYERYLRYLVDAAEQDRVTVIIGNESTWIPDACDAAAQGRPTISAGAAAARACFGLQWYYPHLTMEGVRRSYSAVAGIQRKVAAEHGLDWIDMNAVVPPSAEYYWDFCHTLPAGTSRIADEFASHVAGPVARALGGRLPGEVERASRPASPVLAAPKDRQ